MIVSRNRHGRFHLSSKTEILIPEAISQLVGKRVLTVLAIKDYVQVNFECDVTLTIFNSCRIEPDSLPCINLELELQNYKNEELSLCFSKGAKIFVDLSDLGYRGPEALTVAGADGSYVAW